MARKDLRRRPWEEQEEWFGESAIDTELLRRFAKSERSNMSDQMAELYAERITTKPWDYVEKVVLRELKQGNWNAGSIAARYGLPEESVKLALDRLSKRLPGLDEFLVEAEDLVVLPDGTVDKQWFESRPVEEQQLLLEKGIKHWAQQYAKTQGKVTYLPEANVSTTRPRFTYSFPTGTAKVIK
jgi:hypothetical protein